MKTIFKYEVKGNVPIKIPKGFKIVCFDKQPDHEDNLLLQMWAELDPDSEDQEFIPKRIEFSFSGAGFLGSPDIIFLGGERIEGERHNFKYLWVLEPAYSSVLEKKIHHYKMFGTGGYIPDKYQYICTIFSSDKKILDHVYRVV